MNALSVANVVVAAASAGLIAAMVIYARRRTRSPAYGRSESARRLRRTQLRLSFAIGVLSLCAMCGATTSTLVSRYAATVVTMPIDHQVPPRTFPSTAACSADSATLIQAGTPPPIGRSILEVVQANGFAVLGCPLGPPERRGSALWLTPMGHASIVTNDLGESAVVFDPFRAAVEALAGQIIRVLPRASSRTTRTTIQVAQMTDGRCLVFARGEKPGLDALTLSAPLATAFVNLSSELGSFPRITGFERSGPADSSIVVTVRRDDADQEVVLREEGGSVSVSGPVDPKAIRGVTCRLGRSLSVG